MIKEKLQEGIIVKTKAGDFKVLKNGQLEEITSTEIIVPADDLITLDDHQRALQTELTKKPTANFYMDVSDEHDVSQFKQKDDAIKNRAIKEFIEVKTIETISYAGLGEAATKNHQLKNIIASRIRNVRSLAETKEALNRLVATSNIKWADGWLEALIPLIEKERDNFIEIIYSGDIPQVNNKIDKAKPKVTNNRTGVMNSMMNIKYEKSPEIVGHNELPKNIVMGAVDEIKNISLADFRKLAETPLEAADKILQKISLLEDESLVKKIQGVIAWHESEIYKLYLQIGGASIAKKKPVEQVIRELKESHQPYLVPEEFNVVADLNRKLSY